MTTKAELTEAQKNAGWYYDDLGHLCHVDDSYHYMRTGSGYMAERSSKAFFAEIYRRFDLRREVSTPVSREGGASS